MVTRKEKQFGWIVLISSVLYLVSRILILENDLPAFYLADYQPFDELFYVVSAFDYMEHHAYFYRYNNLEVGNTNLIGPSHILNGLVIFFLKLFGDNYIGLRSAAVLCGLVTFIGTLFISQKICHEGVYGQDRYSGYTKFFPVMVAALLLTDYSFILSNIVIEPTSIRLATVILFIVYLMKFNVTDENSGWLQFLQMGIVATLGWLLVYPTNAFIVLGCVLFISRLMKDASLASKCRSVSAFFLGSASAALSLLFFLGVSGYKYEKEFMEIYSMFVNLVSVADNNKSFMMSGINNLLSVSKANYISFSLFILFVFVPNLFLTIVRFLRFNNSKLFNIVSSLVIAFCVQSFFVNDYPERKQIILFPLVLILIIDNCMFLLSCIEVGKIFARRKKLLYGLMLVHLLMFLLSVVGLHIERHPACFHVEYLKPVYFFGVFLLVAPVSYLINKKLGIFLMAALVMMPSVYYSYKFIYQNQTTRLKDAMSLLDDLPEGSNIMGGASMAFRLYNDNNYALNLYKYYKSPDLYERDLAMLKKESRIDYLIYEEGTENEHPPLRLEPVMDLYMNNCTAKNMVLYKVL